MVDAAALWIAIAAIVIAVIAIILLFVIPGQTGAAGAAGSAGDRGAVGPPGDPSLPGDQGPPGPASGLGVTGPRGPTGIAGVAGPMGSLGQGGYVGGRGQTGQPGQSYIQEFLDLTDGVDITLSNISTHAYVIDKKGSGPVNKIILGANNFIQSTPWTAGTTMIMELSSEANIDEVKVCSLCISSQDESPSNACDTNPPCVAGALYYDAHGSPYVYTLKPNNTYYHTLANVLTTSPKPTIFRAVTKR